ncbi:hypothetical protein CRM22_007467 [Opisthorchis felineus]|uniref:Uncharacterized protein n=1 Tax=Opisthorchis felineus TaxID=147828 RepID=A0A4S2LP24_OPIFE|nr:hypothetical protein CRM22_007467 [Opisthorchis felineus]
MGALFESADADGITEDENIHLPVIYAFGRKGLEDEVVAEPDTSFQGHVTTDSECSSSFSARATTPDRSERRSLSPCVERVDESVPNDATSVISLTLPDDLRAVLSSLSVSDQPPSVLADLTRFTTKHLQTYVDSLLAAVLRLSDRLVELLAMRDELLMLREASDDFIILLDLIHQRRARASRAALLATARGRMRPKGFGRLKLPWITRSLFGTPASSLSSLSEHSTTISRHTAARIRRPGTIFTKDSDTVALNASSGSVAYYKSLNLHSKQRRPKTQPIAVHRENSVTPKLNGVCHSPSHQQNASAHVDNSTHHLSAASSDRAHERLLALRKLCHSLAWPNGQPQLSKSLTLRLPYEPLPVEGVTLTLLRRLNHILHSALLENMATEKMVNAYIENIEGRHQIACWIQEVNNHVNSDLHIPN